MLETIFKEFTIIIKKSNKNQQKFLFGRIFRGKSWQTQTKTSPLACFFIFFWVETQISHALSCTRPVFGSAWATLPISPRRSKRWRRSGEARKNAAYGSYSLRMFTLPILGGSEIRISISWVLKGDVHTMFIPCL